MTLRLSPTVSIDSSGSAVTVAPMSLYVATTGSDTTGDGTALNPYATVERAYADIPKTIRHECKILVEAGDYAGGWPKSIAPVLEDNGTLAIIGVGAPVVVSGPHTVTGVADVGTYCGQLVTVAAGGLGATDSLCGDWIRIDTGGTPGTAHKIGANIDTTVTVNKITAAVQNGDTFSVIRPAVNIATPNGWLMIHALSDVVIASDLVSNRFSYIKVHNITFDASAAPKRGSIVRIKGDRWSAASGSSGLSHVPGPRFDFCKIICSATQSGAVVICNCIVNNYLDSVVAADYATEGATGLVNYASTYGEIPGLSITSSQDRATRMVALQDGGDNGFRS